jgi:hypothetical protein
MKLAVEQSLTEFLIEPYQTQIDDYLMKQAEEEDILGERLNLIERQCD